LEWHPKEALSLLHQFSTRLNYRPIAGPTLLQQSGHYGNALLTRFPVQHIRRHDLSVAGREPRGALDVCLSCDGKPVRIVATHLGLRPAERRAQVEQLLATLEPHDSMSTVFMGDLNEWFLWGRPLRWLRAHFGHTPAPATFPSLFPLFALDRIWVKPRARLLDLKVQAGTPARHASDHLPLRAEIELGDG
ncbi:MAG TPA: endonuclease/exonuclease/phosphatase family protein, partial [Terriglobales bacterium]|nr:endonuclease/exonuclease/phosphatase family protein [Terriglobales bacterium]